MFASHQRLVKRCGQELTEGKHRLQKNENHVQLQQQKRHSVAEWQEMARAMDGLQPKVAGNCGVYSRVYYSDGASLKTAATENNF